ncbi:STM3941 family protein [Chryseobacterium terrae]|uniref:STM3941 family protein n=1 Tax=Chryseobacterium terrae TaxID=3163299 RepID=A0ABW8XZL5_9FLAO
MYIKNYYSNRLKSFLLFSISAFFSVSFIFYDLGNKKIFSVIISYLAFILFTFGWIIALLLLFRRRPLLTITDDQIIIYNILAKPRPINFKDISSFYVLANSFRGIKTGENIHIILKSSAKKTDSKNILSRLFFSVDASIQSDLLNVKTKDLLKILNDGISKKTIK